MKIELLKPDNSSFKQVKANESFLFGGEPFLRIKHSEGALLALCNKKSVTVAGSGFALNLKTGLVTIFADSTPVEKTNFWLKEIK